MGGVVGLSAEDGLLARRKCENESLNQSKQDCTEVGNLGSEMLTISRGLIRSSFKPH